MPIKPSQPLQFANKLIAKNTIKQFANKFDFVYFGNINQHKDNSAFVRGVTMSINHKDSNCIVGNFKGRDITLVQRQDELCYPHRPAKKYNWTIMQVDLRRSGLMHAFIDAHHHEEVFYTNLFIRFPSFENINNQLAINPLFEKNFKVLAARKNAYYVGKAITSDIMAMLAHHFSQFDYEIKDDYLLVYATDIGADTRTLREMMRVGIWLAEQIDNQDIPKPSPN